MFIVFIIVIGPIGWSIIFWHYPKELRDFISKNCPDYLRNYYSKPN